MVIKSYLNDIGQGDRNICLIPSSAHGTNPASAVMAGFKVVVIKTDEFGNIDLEDLENLADANAVKLLIEQHLEYTGSNKAKEVPNNWAKFRKQFVKVMPRDYKRVLEEAKKREQTVVATANG